MEHLIAFSEFQQAVNDLKTQCGPFARGIRSSAGDNEHGIDIGVSLDFSFPFPQLNSVENNVYNSVSTPRISASKNHKAITTAFNGILADINSFDEHIKQCAGVVILFHGKGYPEFSICRDSIFSLPLEAACDLLLTSQLFPRDILPSYLNYKHYELLPEQAFQDVLYQHPEWENKIYFNTQYVVLENGYLEYKKQSLLELQETVRAGNRAKIGSFTKDSLYDYLCLSVLKLHFTLCKDTRNGNKLSLAPGPSDAMSSFPVQFFFILWQKTCRSDISIFIPR